MYLFKASASDATLQDTKVLLCVNIEGFVVDGLVILYGMVDMI
jgi:hypothetical protein